MKMITISSEILAQRLEHAAEVYEKDIVTAREVGDERLQKLFEQQAKESREWAEAFRNAHSIGFDGDDIEIGHHS